jgi:mRNA-degrading endonuclease YafQ of YafQ-DinJ toxin-antitoxin module
MEYKPQDIEKLQGKMHKINNRLLRLMAKVILEYDLTLYPVYRDHALEGVATYIGEWDVLPSTEKDREEANQLLNNFKKEDKEGFIKDVITNKNL